MPQFGVMLKLPQESFTGWPFTISSHNFSSSSTAWGGRLSLQVWRGGGGGGEGRVGGGCARVTKRQHENEGEGGRVLKKRKGNEQGGRRKENLEHS